jgi:hypothetical protein
MAKVDPFLHPIPKELLKDAETRNFFEYFVRWAHDIWIRTGGGNDAVADQGLRETYPWMYDNSAYQDGAEINGLYSANSIVVPEYRALTVSTSTYTAIPYDFINAKSNATIKFPAQPPENCVIIVRNGDGSLITLNGNDKTINGSKNGYLRQKGTAIHFHYFIDSDEWFAR